MPDRWIGFCRRLVPDALRDRVFDPTMHDLAREHLGRVRAARRPLRRAAHRLQLAGRVFAAALECRRISLRPRPSPPLPTLHGDPMLTMWIHDVRHAIRRFAHQPLFVTVAVVTLALGIGANVAIFGFVNSYLLRRLPVPAAAELVRVYGGTADAPIDITSYPNFTDARDGVAGLDLAVHVIAQVAVGDDGATEARHVELVSGTYFRIMQLTPVAGRLIAVRDDIGEGAHPIVVLGEAYWRARYGGNPDIIGQTIRLNAAAYTIVGVAPAAFQGSGGAHVADLWAPITMQRQLRPRGLGLDVRGWDWLSMVGRVAPGASMSSVQAGLDRVAADIDRRFPSKSGAFRLTAVPAFSLPEADRRALAPYLEMTLAFTALLLLVTCANLAGVMQARVIARGRELAIRQSLGAGRARLVSEWLTECLLLATAGGLAGVLVARLTLIAIIRSRPPASLVGDITLDVPMDWRVIAFAVTVSLVAALFFGLMPALRAAAQQPVSVLKEEVATATGGRRGARWRRVAVLVQVATSAALLLGSGLLVASLRNMEHFDVGFAPEHLAMVDVDLKLRRVPPAQAAPLAVDVLTRARAIPGVKVVALVTNVPLTNNHDRDGFRIPGYTAPDGSHDASIDENIVSASYFETLGLSFVTGHTWDARPGTAPSIVINDTMAGRFWPGGNAVGQSVEFIGTGLMTICGVVRDSAYYTIGEPPMPFIYLPAEVANPLTYTLIARTSPPAGDVVAALDHVVTATDARVRALNATTFEVLRDVPLYPRRMMASIASLFGAVALLLTGIGLYGVVSSSVSQRAREIGVRMALGARSSDVLAGVLRDSASLVAIGAGLGLAGGYALAAALRQWLFGVAPFNAGVYACVVGALSVVAVVAAWAPARRAAAIDPVTALRM